MKQTLLAVTLLTFITAPVVASETTYALGAGVADIDGLEMIEFKGSVVSDFETLWTSIGATYSIADNLASYMDGNTLEANAKLGIRVGNEGFEFRPYLAATIGRASLDSPFGDSTDTFTYFGLGAEFQIQQHFVISAEYGQTNQDEYEFDTTRVNFTYKF